MNKLKIINMKLQQGSSIVAAMLFLPIIVAFFALAIDIGYYYVVRNELQNAADAAALAGAENLVRNIIDLTSPDFNTARTKALSVIPLNQANNNALIDGQIVNGYWDVTGKYRGLLSTIGSDTSITYYPAIEVTIKKENAKNNGPFKSFFGTTMLGINSINMTAKAVSVTGGPGAINKDLMPISLGSCIFKNPPTGTFSTGTIYSKGGSNCYTGQWTTYSTNSNSNSVLKSLINYATGAAINPRPAQLTIGQKIWIQTGVKAVDFKLIDACSAINGNSSCAYMVIPVVSGSVSTNKQQQIMGFACVRVLKVTGTGSNTAINLQLILPENTDGTANPNYTANCQIGPTSGFGPGYGAKISPRLVNYSGNDY